MVKQVMKCKNCKAEFTPVRFNQKFCFDSFCVKVWVELEKEKQWKKKKKVLKDELQTVQELTKLAQVVFNKYIRLRDKDKLCVSCGSKLGSKFDAGHYFSSGGHKAVTFDEDNVHGQCVTCNQHKHGNLLNYQIGIQQRIGADRLIELHSRAHDVKKWTKDELNEIIKRYKTKINERTNAI
jgi:hypothetical protein